MKQLDRHSLGNIVSVGVLLCILASFAVSNMHTFFGIYIPKDMVVGITSPLSFGFLGLAVVLHYQRKRPVATRIVRTLVWFLAFVLFVCGWRFVAGEVSPPFQANDGFTVTGGFMMLCAGLISGYLFATNKARGKK